MPYNPALATFKSWIVACSVGSGGAPRLSEEKIAEFLTDFGVRTSYATLL